MFKVLAKTLLGKKYQKIQETLHLLHQQPLRFDQVLNELHAVRAELTHLKNDVVLTRKDLDYIEIDSKDRFNDIVKTLIIPQLKNEKIKIMTDHPVAFYSDDHNHPRGTKNDNTRHPRFVKKCTKLFNKKIKHLDLGCAGGGFVLDFLLQRHFSVGVEGSDYSSVNQRAEWITIPDHLFTADITMPFHFLDDTNNLVQFDVITAWELLEHIPEDRLDALFQNIKNQLNQKEGLFVASIATFEDYDPISGAVWHVTVKSKEWWYARLQKAGLQVVDGIFDHYDFARGSGNFRSRGSDWDGKEHPHMGFHVVCRIAE